jgi:hypothetical protein
MLREDRRIAGITAGGDSRQVPPSMRAGQGAPGPIERAQHRRGLVTRIN